MNSISNTSKFHQVPPNPNNVFLARHGKNKENYIKIGDERELHRLVKIKALSLFFPSNH